VASTLTLPVGEDAGLEVLRQHARPLLGGESDYDPLLELVGDATFVLLGEASHGTHEFYRERARLTKRLITDLGFSAVAVEGDWPDAARVNRYVQGRSPDGDAEEALRDFRRFPTWMWRNTDVVDFVGWLRSHNEAKVSERDQVGFYGLDLYSLNASMEAVVTYLEDVDPAAAERARRRYECLHPFAADGSGYGEAMLLGVSEPCRRRVLEQLVELRRRGGDYLRPDGVPAEDRYFAAEQNATLVADAEEYYRTMFASPTPSWNLRDRHMADTLDQLHVHLARHGGNGKIVVWEHNSHVGDARFTEMSRRGELNVGQLARERHGREAVLVGYTTHTGTVTAASEWGGEAQRMRVRPALADSYEALLHATDLAQFVLCPLGSSPCGRVLREPRLERAIGVIYKPESERTSHWFAASAAQQFDALVHTDITRAAEPLERSSTWELGEPPETYPSAL
jgi:erythromycin esterase-like protein